MRDDEGDISSVDRESRVELRPFTRWFKTGDVKDDDDAEDSAEEPVLGEGGVVVLGEETNDLQARSSSWNCILSMSDMSSSRSRWKEL